MAEDRSPQDMTPRELWVAVGGMAAAVLAVVALLLGHALVAAILGVFAAAGIMAGGPSGATAWGSGDGRWSMSETDFEGLVHEVEQARSESTLTTARAREARDPHDPDHFKQLIRDALDELPEFMQAELGRNIAVVISDDGAKHGAYGLYSGGTAARDTTSACVVIFRDTLLQDFGDDPDELRRQVTRVVRHELAHHLGATEGDEKELGL